MIILSVGESHPKKFKLGAVIIKAVECTDHTHSFISWCDEELSIRKVCESRGGGGRLVINEQFREENFIVRVFQYEVSQENLKALEVWAWTHLKPYGYLHNLGIGIMRLENACLKLIRSKKKAVNRFKDGSYSSICVEQTAMAVAIATGIALPGDIEDYGLREMHDYNEQNVEIGRCSKASQELLAQINRT